MFLFLLWAGTQHLALAWGPADLSPRSISSVLSRFSVLHWNSQFPGFSTGWPNSSERRRRGTGAGGRSQLRASSEPRPWAAAAGGAAATARTVPISSRPRCPSRGEGTAAELGTRRENWADEGGWGRTIGLKIDAVPPWTGRGSSTQGASGRRMTRLTVTATSGLAPPPPGAAPPPAGACRLGAGPRPATSPRRGAPTEFSLTHRPRPLRPFPQIPSAGQSERVSRPDRGAVRTQPSVLSLPRSRAASLAKAEARRALSSRPLGAQASPRAPCASSLGRDAAVEAWGAGGRALGAAVAPRPALLLLLLLLPRCPPTLTAAGPGRLGASARTKEAPAASA